jgi:hypothetical protein
VRETISGQDRRLIVAAVKRGGTAEEVASLYGRSSKAVRKIAKEENLKLARQGRQAKHDLTLRLPAAAIGLLAAAARRRGKSAEDVASNIVIGTLTRGCIDW